MQVNILRVRVGRYDDEVISRKVIGQKRIPASSYAEAIVRSVTGQSCAGAVGALLAEIGGGESRGIHENHIGLAGR